MKAGWEVKKLGDICEILDRLRKPITKRNRVPGPYPYYGATGVLDHVDGFLFDETLVLLGEDGAKWEPGARSAFSIDGKTWVNNHAHVMRPNRAIIDDNWLIYFLNFSDLMPFVSGMTVPKLNQGSLREIQIPLPPLAEQKRIVSILDEAFEGLDRARENAEANLKSARELFEQSVTKTFSKIAEQASKTQLGLCAGFKNGLNYGQSSNGQAIRIVGVGDFQNLYWVPSAGLKTVQIDGQLSQDDLLQEGDILAVRSNGNRALIGRTMLCGPLSEPTSFSGFCIRIRLTNDSLLSSYVCYFMKTKALRNILSEGGDGANISNLNQKMLSELDIPIPSTAIQSKTVSLITSLEGEKDRLQALYQTKLQDISDLRQSLLQKAFAGELT